MEKQAKPDVSVAFFVSAFEGLLGNYGIDYEAPMKIPNPPPKEQPATKKGRDTGACSFQSRIADLRLKRAQDQADSIYADADKKIENDIARYANAIAGTPSSNIAKAFEAERAERPDVPLYIRNNDKHEMIWWKEKKPPRPINMAKIQKEYSERLKLAETTGKNRAMNRKKKLEQHVIQGNQILLNQTQKTTKPSTKRGYYPDQSNTASGSNYYEGQ